MAASSPQIKIDDHPLHPSRTEATIRPTSQGGGIPLAGGVYHSRDISSAPYDRRFSTSRVSQDRRSNAPSGDEDGSRWQDGHLKTKQVFRGTTLLWLAYQSIGVIYGDIGTSPLYVFSSTFTSEPDYQDLVQVLSIIIWSITLVVTVKYVVIILHADNEGEGGTFSCYSLLTRFANIANRDPRDQGLIRMERHLSSDLKPSSRTLRNTLEKTRFFRGLLKTIGVLAVSMVMADGVLTPAQSVLGAVQGLNVVRPDLSSSAIVGTSCGILVLLFLIQPLGTTRLASSFAPIVILWLSFNGGFGIYNLVMHDASVAKAFNPYYVFEFFIQHKTEGWKMLGGVLLAFTGVEALFADLGAFSLRAIQISWLCYAYPCLLLGYLGQAAFISRNPWAYSNPFYNSVPPGMLYPSLVCAVLAAIVASQAIITATFQLMNQIMKLSFCPQFKVVHTSSLFHGQVYVPVVNWLLMVGAVLVTAVYSNTTRLGNAYGVCVMFVTFFDTCMVTLVALIVWRLSPFIVVLPWLIFACIDGVYLSSSLIKVPDGAWLTLLISGILTGIFLLWRFGKENQWRAEAEDHFRLGALLETDNTTDSTGLRLTRAWGGDSLSKIKGFGIYFDKTGVMTPTVFTQFASKFVAVTDIVVFFHLHPVEVPSVPPEERYTIMRFKELPGCYRLVVKRGFMDEVISPDLATLIYAQIRKHITQQAVKREGACDRVETAVADPAVTQAMGKGMAEESGPGTRAPNEPVEPRDAAVAAQLARLDRAYGGKVMYIVGKEQMRIRDDSPWTRRVILGTFLWIRENTRAKIANLRLAMERVVEVGFVKDI